eukprot:4185583-Karenia_brevis.AAC.1
MESKHFPKTYPQNFVRRWQEAVGKLQKLLRPDVLLPLHPDLKNMGVSWKDVDTPVALPAWHCAFQNCVACSDKWQDRNNHQKDLWQH